MPLVDGFKCLKTEFEVSSVVILCVTGDTSLKKDHNRSRITFIFYMELPHVRVVGDLLKDLEIEEKASWTTLVME